MARKSKYTPETTAKIMKAISLGATYELAAHYAGISYELLRQWMQDKAKVAFLEELKRAEGIAALVWLGMIDQAAKDGNWQAAAWKLERRYPHMYGRNVTQVEHSGVMDVRFLIPTPESPPPEDPEDEDTP